MIIQDFKIIDININFDSYKNRVPLKFGHEITTEFSIARIKIKTLLNGSLIKEGIGEVPIAVAWTWPAKLSYKERDDRMKNFILMIKEHFNTNSYKGHPFDITNKFLNGPIYELLDKEFELSNLEKMPYLSALVCYSPFDIALYDAISKSLNVGAFDILSKKFLEHDLSYYINEDFKGLYPEDFLVKKEFVPKSLVVWHMVGGTDPLTEEDDRNIHNDGYPVLLEDWIKQDGIKCIKIKLSGLDFAWDCERIIKVGEIAIANKVEYLSIDFNCTAQSTEYVLNVLSEIERRNKSIYDMILYIEQPFDYNIDNSPKDVYRISQKKLLMMDECADNWRAIEKGLKLGWNGVALKSCKSITNSILMLCYGRFHGMKIMVQDLTNPRLAIIPHLQLAAHVGTIMGVEANSMQFCPDASKEEAKIHPNLYRRRDGKIDISSIGKIGIGY